MANKLLVLVNVRFVEKQIGAKNDYDGVISRLVNNYGSYTGRRFAGHYDMAGVDVVLFEILNIVLTEDIVTKLRKK